MKNLICLLILLISNNLIAQTHEEPNLKIVGSARVNVKPDIGILNIYISSIKPQMSEAVKSLREKSGIYTKALIKINFQEKDIKTTNFSVHKNRVYREHESIDSGYLASQEIRVEFEYSEQILTKILNEFSKNTEEVAFGFDFKLSEPLKAKVQKQIIDLAVIDAKQKGKDISQSSGIKLIRIKSISYGASGWRENGGMEMIEKQYDADHAEMTSEASNFYGFTPEDLLFQDTIEYNWIIE